MRQKLPAKQLGTHHNLVAHLQVHIYATIKVGVATKLVHVALRMCNKWMKV